MSFDLPTPIQPRPSAAQPQPRGWLNIRSFVVLIATACLAFIAGAWFSSSMDSRHNDDDFQPFWQAWDILAQDYYYDLPQDKELTYGAIQGLYASAEDRYTFFVPPTEAEFDQQMMDGEFGGIGAYVGQNQDGLIVITMPFEGFPAEKAGLKADDIIFAVDGTDIRGWTLEDAVGLLRGEIGTDVELSIYRPSDQREFAVEITRAKVELPTVISEMYGDIGYVRLFSFNGNATALLKEKIEALKAGGARALILDLRSNPGGLLDQAISVSDLFLDEGVVVTQRDKKGKEVIYRSGTGDLAEDMPLVILIDGLSASASEVVAGALGDRDRATLIGQTSYGKGSVQHVHTMQDGSQLHITAALWFTPNETPIQGQGLKPDIQVELPEDQAENVDQFYIDAALQYLREQLAPTDQDM
jgi:carboxyl-terminal processing protease